MQTGELNRLIHTFPDLVNRVRYSLKGCSHGAIMTVEFLSQQIG